MCFSTDDYSARRKLEFQEGPSIHHLDIFAGLCLLPLPPPFSPQLYQDSFASNIPLSHAFEISESPRTLRLPPPRRKSTFVKSSKPIKWKLSRSIVSFHPPFVAGHPVGKFELNFSLNQTVSRNSPNYLISEESVADITKNTRRVQV